MTSVCTEAPVVKFHRIFNTELHYSAVTRAAVRKTMSEDNHSQNTIKSNVGDSNSLHDSFKTDGTTGPNNNFRRITALSHVKV